MEDLSKFYLTIHVRNQFWLFLPLLYPAAGSTLLFCRRRRTNSICPFSTAFLKSRWQVCFAHSGERVLIDFLVAVIRVFFIIKCSQKRKRFWNAKEATVDSQWLFARKKVNSNETKLNIWLELTELSTIFLSSFLSLIEHNIVAIDRGHTVEQGHEDTFNSRYSDGG